MRDYGDRLAAVVRVRVSYNIKQCPGSTRAYSHPAQVRYLGSLIEGTWELKPGSGLLDGDRMSNEIPKGGSEKSVIGKQGRETGACSCWGLMGTNRRTNPSRQLGSYKTHSSRIRVLTRDKKIQGPLVPTDPFSPMAKGQKKIQCSIPKQMSSS